MSDREILIEPILTDIGFKPIVDIRLLTLVYTRKMINGVWDTSVSDGAYNEPGTRWVFLRDLTTEHWVAQSKNEGLFWVPFNLYAKYIKGNQQENSMSNLGDRDWTGPKNLDGSNFWENQPTNIILNAAAPQLLEALKVALARLETAAREQRYDHNTFDDLANDEAIDTAEAAIKKATGEKS